MNLHEELAAKDALITLQVARIADLEREIAGHHRTIKMLLDRCDELGDGQPANDAAPSAPAVEQDKVICANLGELLLTPAQRKAADTDKVRTHKDVEWLIECAEMAKQNPALAAEIRAKCKAASAAVDTDKVREALADELHNGIMNLPCKVARAVAMHGATEQAYREGHRDARHAAAELAANMAAQAPVREVPKQRHVYDWLHLVETKIGTPTAASAARVLKEFYEGAEPDEPLPAAPVHQGE